MSKLIASPVELGFSEFVSKLISDTFDAVIVSSINQEENWSNLNKLLSLELSEFADQVISDDEVLQELTGLFPDGEGGTQIVPGTLYKRESSRAGNREKPSINTLLGYQPKGRTLSEVDVDYIKQIVKKRLAETHYELLSKMASKGQTKVIVDAGKINAKLNFQVLQVEETNEENNATEENNLISKATLNKSLFLSKSFPMYSNIKRPLSLNKIHFFVKPPTDSDPQSHQVKANVYGEVEIQFKTIS